MSSARPRRAAATRSRIIISSSDDSDVDEMPTPKKATAPKAAPKRKQTINNDSPEPVRASPAKKKPSRVAKQPLKVRNLSDSEADSSKLIKKPTARKTTAAAKPRKVTTILDSGSSLELVSEAQNRKRHHDNASLVSDDSSEPIPTSATKKVRVAANPPLVTNILDSDDDAMPAPTIQKTTVNKTKAAAKPRKVVPTISTPEISFEMLSDDEESDLLTFQQPNNPITVLPPPKASAKPPPIINTSNRRSSRYVPPTRDWNPAQLLADKQSLDYATAQHIIRLFEEDNTIPFMCRYRRELIGDLSPEQMRDIKITYNHILNVKNKADTMLRHLEKEDLCTDEIRSNIVSARSLDELEHLYAPYKPASKMALSERAKAIGLQTPAETLMYGEAPAVPLRNYVDIEVPGLESLEKVQEGMQHIGAHLISKDARVLEELRKLQRIHRIQLTSKLIPPKKTTATTKETAKPVDPSKFETYFEFRQAISYVRPHQVLAINRGESQKVLNVKVEVPDSLRNDLYRFTRHEYLSDGMMSGERERFFDKAFDEAYSKKLQPLITRQVRGELTKTAETASIEVFATNLKQLLLMSPVKGERILGIDPGFTNGCKLALISEQTSVLDTAVVYPHTRRHQADAYGERVARMLHDHNCTLIALGNGTACRETEKWLAALMSAGVLDGQRVRYCIVSEQGASIYSCGSVAKQEFPDLDVNLISAVSIARRLNDPLGEFVKVEPRHLGVGMYQHDVNTKLLAESLNEVVMECVSFVGVDINTASMALLQHVSGLTAVRAANIIKYREENGPFASREQLKSVKQIGEKTFLQCAGFVRIEPLTAGPKSAKSYNPLDSTWVHPESYDLAQRIVADSGSRVPSIGTPEGIAQIAALLARKSTAQIGRELGVAEERVSSVVAALQRELLRDYRVDLGKRPMFKQGLTSMADLRAGTAVSGAITNQTHFGCFVDIGVEKDGLIHSSQLGGQRPNIGDRVEALVQDVDVKRGRIQLKLVAIC